MGDGIINQQNLMGDGIINRQNLMVSDNERNQNERPNHLPESDESQVTQTV